MRTVLTSLLITLCMHSAIAQCTTNPNDINYLSRNSRLTNFCGDINAYCNTGVTILMGACSYGKNLPLIEDCLKLKPDIFKLQRADSGQVDTINVTRFTACHFITFPSTVESKGPKDPLKSMSDEIEILKLFVQYFPQDSSLIYSYSFESLVKYTSCCDNTVFTYLEPRLNFNYRNSVGDSYLHMAIRFSQIENAMWLCTRGLDLTARNSAGVSPIDLLKLRYKGAAYIRVLKGLRKCSQEKQHCRICPD